VIARAFSRFAGRGIRATRPDGLTRISHFLTAPGRHRRRCARPRCARRAHVAKTYLRDLEARGVDVARTSWIAAGDARTLAEVIRDAGLVDVVVKPVVSMNGDDTWRCQGLPTTHDEATWRRLVATRAMMVQAFVPEIAGGEVSLVFFDRAFSHALRKFPRDGEFRVQIEHGGRRVSHAPSPSTLGAARRALDAVDPLDGALVWSRVDGVEVGDRFVVMEVEAIDPTLFFAFDADAPARFAAAIARAIGA
jgi:glutathione synthase/RimK-type ligase-like ATP-grasp enzyme